MKITNSKEICTKFQALLDNLGSLLVNSIIKHGTEPDVCFLTQEEYNTIKEYAALQGYLGKTVATSESEEILGMKIIVE